MNDLEVYKKAISALSRGENIAVITVISTTGSTPGKIGYKMLVWGKNGETIGTVGGGLTEANVLNIAKKTLPKTVNQVVKFNLDGTEDDEKGICGGSIEFLIVTLDKNSPRAKVGMLDTNLISFQRLNPILSRFVSSILTLTL